MSSRLRTLLPVALLALTATSLAAVNAPATAAPVAVSMDVSPNTFTGGQLITYSGNVGAADVVVKLQGSQRPGAPWSVLARTRSAADGSYVLRQPAPAMRGIQRRVVAGGTASDSVRMYAQSQDIVMTPVGRPVVGHKLDVVVSTVPGPHWPRGHAFFVAGRPDLPAPVLQGRALHLEQRNDDGTWTRVEGAVGTVDEDGVGTLTVTPDEVGTPVYRVVQEDYAQSGGAPIGWFPSFPTPVEVAATQNEATTYDMPDLDAADPVTTTSVQRSSTAARTVVAAAPATGESGVTAQQRYTWGGAKWDFGLPNGESLTSPPSRGKSLQGWWLDGSDGGGRANQHNGGISLNSQRYAPAKNVANENAGDRGSTWITLQDQAQKFGRWETRVRLRSYEKAARDYRTVVELVPDATSRALGGQACVPQGIVVADLAAHSSTMRLGATSARAGRQWSANRQVGNIENTNIAVAVEVGRKHVTWFVDGKPVGTVRGGKAVPRVPLTLRITQRGDGDHEMNRTMAHMDWMRGFTLKKGQQVKRSSKVGNSPFRGC